MFFRFDVEDIALEKKDEIPGLKSGKTQELSIGQAVMSIEQAI